MSQKKRNFLTISVCTTTTYSSIPNTYMDICIVLQLQFLIDFIKNEIKNKNPSYQKQFFLNHSITTFSQILKRSYFDPRVTVTILSIFVERWLNLLLYIVKKCIGVPFLSYSTLLGFGISGSHYVTINKYTSRQLLLYLNINLYIPNTNLTVY